MREVELKYTTNGKDIHEVYSFPSTWNELNLKQLLYVANFWQAWQDLAKSGQSLIKAKASLVLKLIDGTTRFNLWKRFTLLDQLSNEDKYDICQLTNFIFEKNTLTVCPLPVLKLRFKQFFSPNDKLGNITAFEFHFADLFYMDYHLTGKEESLNCLIACLYREAVGGKRIAFNHEDIDKRAKIIKRLSYAEKQLILLWYIGCRYHIVMENKILFSESNSKQAESTGWLPLILAMSGGKFGTFNATGNTDFALIMMELKNIDERKPKT